MLDSLKVVFVNDGFFRSIKIICYDPTHLPEGKGEQVMAAGSLQGAHPALVSRDTHPGATPGGLCQHFPYLLVCLFSQAKTSQTNRCLNKDTATLEYNVLMFIKQTIARLEGRPQKLIRTKPLHLPSKQNKTQDLDFLVKSIPWAAALPWPATVSQGQTYL